MRFVGDFDYHGFDIFRTYVEGGTQIGCKGRNEGSLTPGSCSDLQYCGIQPRGGRTNG